MQKHGKPTDDLTVERATFNAVLTRLVESPPAPKKEIVKKVRRRSRLRSLTTGILVPDPKPQQSQ